MTYKDFEIGQLIMCKTDISDTKFIFYLENDHLIPGNWYTITDLDFHFPDSICVNPSSKLSGMFCPIEFFDVKSAIREKKLNEILNK